MSEILIRKLERSSPLEDHDRKLIRDTIGQERSYPSGGDIFREGEAPSNVHLVTSGLAYRYKTLEEGKRQIVGFLLPGDICDLHVFVLRSMDHSIGCVDATSVIDIPRADIERLL